MCPSLRRDARRGRRQPAARSARIGKILIQVSAVGGLAPPGSQGAHAQDPQLVVHDERQCVAGPQAGVRLVGGLAVDADDAGRDEMGTSGASAE